MINQHSGGIITFRVADDQIEYLLLHYVGGHWDFPKGKLEEGEDSLTAAHRELEEETGLEAEIISGFQDTLDYIFTDHKGRKIHKKVTYYIGKVTDWDTVTLSHEHKGYTWLPFNQAYTRVTFDNARSVLSRANTFLSVAL